MSAEQPGPLPSYREYDRYGYGNQPAPPAKMPDFVRYAFFLMLGGAGLQAVSIIVALAQVGTIRSAIRDAELRQNQTLSSSAIDTLVNVIIVLIVLIGIVYVGLWLWMAFKNRAGRNWARITGTVFFGLYALSTVGSLASRLAGVGKTNAFSAGTTIASTAIGLAVLTVGLVTVILLWNSRSSAYFTPPFMPYGGGYPAPAGGYPPPSPYGQPVPYGGPHPGMPGFPPQAPPPPSAPPAQPYTPPGAAPGEFPPPA